MAVREDKIEGIWMIKKEKIKKQKINRILSIGSVHVINAELQ